MAVLSEDVQVEVNDRKFLRQKVALQWLNQTSDPLTYIPGDTCNRNSPKCILTQVVGYTGEGANITLSSEEDTRLCRLANGDLSDDEDVEDTESKMRKFSLIQQQNRTANYTLFIKMDIYPQKKLLKRFKEAHNSFRTGF